METSMGSAIQEMFMFFIIISAIFEETDFNNLYKSKIHMVYNVYFSNVSDQPNRTI